MGVMIIPLVSSLSEDAMHAVPSGLKEGAYALGSRRIQVALKIVFPAALSGITASIILAMSRAIGETMIVAIAAGQQPTTLNLSFPSRRSPPTSSRSAWGHPARDAGIPDDFRLRMTLFVITFILNVISFKLRKHFQEVYE